MTDQPGATPADTPPPATDGEDDQAQELLADAVAATDDTKKPDDDQPLGEKGLRALQREREAREALAKELKAYEPLKKLVGALGDGEPANGKTDIEQLTERLTNHEKELATEREARWRAEVANEKKLTPEQAAELRGSTRDELIAHADRLLTLFPAAAAGTPKPDPTQGARGGGSASAEALIAEAQAKGDWKTVLHLQNQKLGPAEKELNK